MISFLCLAIPPILLLYIRSKVVGKNEHKTLENRIVEYCFALLFLNFVGNSDIDNCTDDGIFFQKSFSVKHKFVRNNVKYTKI